MHDGSSKHKQTPADGGGAGEVDVTGPVGPSKVACKVITRTGNLSVSTSDGYMSKGGPNVSEPDIT